MNSRSGIARANADFELTVTDAVTAPEGAFHGGAAALPGTRTARP